MRCLQGYLKNTLTTSRGFYYQLRKVPGQTRKRGLVAVGGKTSLLRGEAIAVPSHETFEKLGIRQDLASGTTGVRTLSSVGGSSRELVLATQMNEERTYSPNCLRFWSWMIESSRFGRGVRSDLRRSNKSPSASNVISRSTAHLCWEYALAKWPWRRPTYKARCPKSRAGERA